MFLLLKSVYEAIRSVVCLQFVVNHFCVNGRKKREKGKITSGSLIRAIHD